MKKRKKSHGPTPLQTVRSETNYKGARDFFGTPFIIAGSVLLLPAILGAMVMFTSASGRTPLVLLGSIISLITSLFCFSISSLGSAVFDIADCAIREDARKRHREARESYEAYRESAEL